MAELKAECEKRRLEFNHDATKYDLIELLTKNDNEPPDWGRIYSRMLYHTGMSYEEIGRRTIPQIEAILDGANENIQMKMSVPNIFGGTTAGSTKVPQVADGPPKLSQFAAIANMFDGI